MTHEARSCRRGDRGQVTAFVVVLMVGLMVMAGLVVDGGRYFTARRNAQNLAAGAARAGAQGLSEDSLRDREAQPTLDPDDAYRRAEAYLAAAGTTGTIVVNADTVTVTVANTVSPSILGIVGVGDRTLTATETAVAQPGPAP
jgi:Flp pilus assembly protein TadG